MVNTVPSAGREPWRKRFRGAARYYRALRRTAAAFTLDLSEPRWFDLWHHHFDFSGHGRRGARHRRQHLQALFTAFDRVVLQSTQSGRSIQVFVSIAPSTMPEQDALYVHTPNPNGTPFPHQSEGVRWDATVPPTLRPFIDGKPWDVGAALVDGETWWVVRYRAGA